jgi:hypothetical protein
MLNVVMLSVVMLRVVMLSVVMLSVVLLNVVAPNGYLKPTFFHVHPTNPDAKLTKLNPVKKLFLKRLGFARINLPENEKIYFFVETARKKMHESLIFAKFLSLEDVWIQTLNQGTLTEGDGSVRLTSL